MLPSQYPSTSADNCPNSSPPEELEGLDHLEEQYEPFPAGQAAALRLDGAARWEEAEEAEAHNNSEEEEVARGGR